jgi:hypothetical protein
MMACSELSSFSEFFSFLDIFCRGDVEAVYLFLSYTFLQAVFDGFLLSWALARTVTPWYSLESTLGPLLVQDSILNKFLSLIALLIDSSVCFFERRPLSK